MADKRLLFQDAKVYGNVLWEERERARHVQDKGRTVWEGDGGRKNGYDSRISQNNVLTLRSLPFRSCAIYNPPFLSPRRRSYTGCEGHAQEVKEGTF